MVHLLSQKLFNKVQIVKVFNGPSILPTIHRIWYCWPLEWPPEHSTKKISESTFLTPSTFLHLSKVFSSLNQLPSWTWSSPLGRFLNNNMTKVVERCFFEIQDFVLTVHGLWCIFLSPESNPWLAWFVHYLGGSLSKWDLGKLNLILVQIHEFSCWMDMSWVIRIMNIWLSALLFESP